MIEYARGEYIARMDGDDIAYSNRFEEQIKIFDKYNDIDLVFCDTDLIDHKGKKICQSWRPQNLDKILEIIELNNFIPHPTVMLKSKLFEKYGKYNPNDKYYRMEDLELWQRLIKNDIKFYYLKKNLLKFRINPNSVRVDGKINIYYKLANTCIANNNKSKAMEYFPKLSFKEKTIISLKMIIPFKLLFYKGLFFNKYLRKFVL